MNLLHLSDIHFGRNYDCYGLPDHFAKHDQILDELIEKIAQMDDALKPEHILFTGDIVWNGKENEYEEALTWFKRLLCACHLTGKDLSFCVGNHDIDLSQKNRFPQLENITVQAIDERYRYENLQQTEACLYEYNKFCHALGVEPYVYPFDGKRGYSYSVGFKDVPFSEGKTIRIFAMNTSLMMMQRGIAHDRMWLGREQILSLMEYGILPAENRIWYTIGLMHHSDRFLDPRETSTYDGRNASLPLLMGVTDLLLCGHTESCGLPRIVRQQGGGALLSGGAAYYNDDHQNAFSLLYISEKKRAMGYLPYVYENGWKDREFETPSKRSPKKQLESEGCVYQNARILIEKCGAETEECENGKGKKERIKDAQFEIPCETLCVHVFETQDKKGKRVSKIRLDNAKEVTRTFCIEATGPREHVTLCIQPNEAQFVCEAAKKQYQKLINFLQENAACSYQGAVVAEDGQMVAIVSNIKIIGGEER